MQPFRQHSSKTEVAPAQPRGNDAGRHGSAPPHSGPSAFVWLFAFAVPFAGTVSAIAVMGGVRSGNVRELTARLSALEAGFDHTQPTRLPPPVFVIDPSSEGAESASLANAVAELSRQVAQLQERAANGGDTEQALLSSDDADERRQALRRMRGRVKTDPQALAAIKGLLADPDARIRKEAIDALESLESPAHIPAMKALLTDADSSVRGRAAKALADMAENSTDPAVRSAAANDIAALLVDKDSRARMDAVRGLHDLGGPESVQGLLRALADKDFEVQGEAIRGLGEVGDAQALGALRQSYGDGTGPSALDAALALKRMGDGSAFEKESTRLQSQATSASNSDDRRHALRVLAENAPTQARPLLEQALRDPSDRVRRDARRALDELGR
ncbi:MAG: HEAT repeat domain-containing protein [Deltaproteobacteria bacterium]|nr:HEAT repeat domain-containing protein [Deltaproteobacteria bacterium]